jgi:acyl-CoA synthetase (AMP-forming)/AMP-acid ligase II
MPEGVAFRFTTRRGHAWQDLSYGALDLRAAALAQRLRAQGLEGAAAVLLHPPGLDFVQSFFGCVYAGVTPAPVALSLLPDGLRKIGEVVKASGARAILAGSAHLGRLQAALAGSLPEDLRWVDTDTPLARGSAVAAGQDDDIAFLQYSSGSTGAPKGIPISHGNVLHALGLLNEAFAIEQGDVGANWLPHNHDMGLVAGILLGPYAGIPMVLMSPLTFLLRPIEWLGAISDHRATISAGPNFAYEHCLNGIAPDQLATLDLRCWDVAVTGAEPIRPATLERFADTFGACGFRDDAFFAGYGLAEATLMVSGPRRGGGAHVVSFQAAALDAQRAEPIRGPDDDARRLVACGEPFLDVVIADPVTGVARGPGELGEILVSGPSIMRGYNGAGSDTGLAFVAPDGLHPSFLRTGDLGFLHGGELFILGRLKDLIIIRGRNLHPQDIETTLAVCHPALEGGRGAAFSVDGEREEILVLVQEIGPDVTAGADELAGLITLIRDVVRQAHDVDAAAVVLLPAGQIPKTTSGKVQRRSCRSLYLGNELRTLAAWRRDDVSAPMVAPL